MEDPCEENRTCFWRKAAADTVSGCHADLRWKEREDEEAWERKEEPDHNLI
jgi:hypothetical protein